MYDFIYLFIFYLFVKIGMKLPFTLKNKRRIFFFKLEFKNNFLDPQKVRFWFLKKNPQHFCSSCFGFDSALKTIDAQMFFWLIFLKMHKKNYWQSKTPFWLFLAVFSQILTKLTFVRLLFLKLKQKKNRKKKIFKGFFQTQKCNFSGLNQFLFFIFFCFSFQNNRRTNKILVSIFEISQKIFINCQKPPKWHFWQSITYFSVLSKIPTKRTFVHL